MGVTCLLQLQGLCKTDPEVSQPSLLPSSRSVLTPSAPQSYADEFQLRLRHFRSLLVRLLHLC